MSPEAKNFQRIFLAREDHDSSCPKGKADRVYMNPFDIERMRWDEGDVIAGLVLYADSQLAPDRLRISCPGERAPSHSEFCVPILDETSTEPTTVKPLSPSEIHAAS